MLKTIHHRKLARAVKPLIDGLMRAWRETTARIPRGPIPSFQT